MLSLIQMTGVACLRVLVKLSLHNYAYFGLISRVASHWNQPLPVGDQPLLERGIIQILEGAVIVYGHAGCGCPGLAQYHENGLHADRSERNMG